MSAINEKGNLNYSAIFLCSIFVAVYAFQSAFNLELAYRPGVDFYRFFTSFFAHSGIEHLFNNIFFLGLFGTVYEIHTDSRTFLLTFLVSAVLANFTAFYFYPETFILGASAGAMGVLSALAVYRPNQIGIGLGVPMPMWAVLISYIFIDVVGLSGVTNTAHEAHLAGLAVGLVMGYSMRKAGKDNYGKKTEAQVVDEDKDEEFENWEQRIRRWEEKWMK